MRTGALIAVMLAVFVVVPGAIFAFHSAPAPAQVNPAAEKLLNHINSLELARVYCRAVHRRVICTTDSRADTTALTDALLEYPAPRDCETRGHRTVCVLGKHL
jgi:hypothetical protein